MRYYTLFLLLFSFSSFLKANTPIAAQIEADTRIIVETAQPLVFADLQLGQEIGLRVRNAHQKNGKILIEAGAAAKGKIIELRTSLPNEPAAILISAQKIQTADGSWVETHSYPEVFQGFENGVDRVEVLAGSVFRVLTKSTPNPETSSENTSTPAVIPLNEPLGNEAGHDTPSYFVPTENMGTVNETLPSKKPAQNPYLDSLASIEMDFYLDSTFAEGQFEIGSYLPVFLSEDVFSENGTLLVEEGHAASAIISNSYGNTLYLQAYSMPCHDGETLFLEGPLEAVEIEETEEGKFIAVELMGKIKQ